MVMLLSLGSAAMSSSLENENKQMRTANEQLRQNLTAVSNATQVN